jgi:hypothetical protein
MSNVQDLFERFTKVFNFFGLWPKPPLSKTRKHITIASFVIFEVLSLVLIVLSFLQVVTIDDFVLSCLYTVAYSWAIAIEATVLINHERLKQLLTKLIKIFAQDDEALPFIHRAFIRAKFLGQLVIVMTFIVTNIAMILIPMLFNVLPIPMWRPSNVSNDTSFYAYWVYQITCHNFIIQAGVILVFFFTLIILMHGYAEFLAFKLRYLMAGEGFDGIGELKRCIEVHQKLKG